MVLKKKDMVLILILFWINLLAVLDWLSILLKKLTSSEFLFIYYHNDNKAWIMKDLHNVIILWQELEECDI